MLFPWCSLPPDWRQLGSLEELVLEAFQSRGPGELGGAGHRSGWGWGSGSLAGLEALSRLHLQLGTRLPGAHLIGQRLGRVAFSNVPCCTACMRVVIDAFEPASSFSAAATEVASAPNLKGIIAHIHITTISDFGTNKSESDDACPLQCVSALPRAALVALPSPASLFASL